MKKNKIRASSTLQSLWESNVRKNKSSIATILLKGLAAKLRERYKELRIEAHPDKFIECARLVASRPKEDEYVTIYLSKGLPKPRPWGQPVSEMHYFAVASLKKKNKLPKRKHPDPLIFMVDDPECVDRLEEWVCEMIDWIFYLNCSKLFNQRYVGDSKRPPRGDRLFDFLQDPKR